ncbi:MAG: hypothetical protein WBF87_15470 [Mesorhizobium sp.]
MTDDTVLFGRPYLGDARLDRLMGMVFSLAGEVAVLKAEVARLSGQSSDEEISSELQAFAREILTPLTDPDPKHTA